MEIPECPNLSLTILPFGRFSCTFATSDIDGLATPHQDPQTLRMYYRASFRRHHKAGEGNPGQNKLLSERKFVYIPLPLSPLPHTMYARAYGYQ